MVGELLIRGDNVMKGYWKREKETRETITKDGWLRTGDIAYMDKEGYIYIVDRIKDMIIVNGEMYILVRSRNVFMNLKMSENVPL